VQLCVGAAFDFHAGNKKMAPRWMQKRGLEWFYRLTQEPTRLWKRYFVIHTTFGYLLTRRMILGGRFVVPHLWFRWARLLSWSTDYGRGV
jgi:UDP-N-acetyl-D-mannosaminuronic acid transferase (WecB/TagA/CpsF family)